MADWWCLDCDRSFGDNIAPDRRGSCPWCGSRASVRLGRWIRPLDLPELNAAISPPAQAETKGGQEC